MAIYCLSLIDDWDVVEEWAGRNRVRIYRYNDARGFVVIASSEDEARKLAAEYAGPAPWWLDPKITTCEVVTNTGNPRVVMGDWPTG